MSIAGVDYHFVPMEQMEHDIRNGEFVQAGKYNDQLYGTSITAIKAECESVSTSCGSLDVLFSFHLSINVHFLDASNTIK
jgi:guanylate kinase